MTISSIWIAVVVYFGLFMMFGFLCGLGISLATNRISASSILSDKYVSGTHKSPGVPIVMAVCAGISSFIFLLCFAFKLHAAF